MPRLVLFAACEKAIIEQNTQVLSLMSLLQDINVQIRPDTVVDPKAAIPIQWVVVSIWQIVQQDQGKAFEQRTQLVTSAEVLKLETPIAPLKLQDKFHRIMNQINGLPIATAGAHRLRCLLREQGATEWTEVGSYPININWQTETNPIIH